MRKHRFEHCLQVLSAIICIEDIDVTIETHAPSSVCVCSMHCSPVEKLANHILEALGEYAVVLPNVLQLSTLQVRGYITAGKKCVPAKSKLR